MFNDNYFFFIFEVCVFPCDFVLCVFSTPVIIRYTPLCECQYLHDFWAKCVKGHITNLLSRKDSTKGQQLGKSPTLVMWVHLGQLCCILCRQTVWHLCLDQVLCAMVSFCLVQDSKYTVTNIHSALISQLPPIGSTVNTGGFADFAKCYLLWVWDSNATGIISILLA